MTEQEVVDKAQDTPNADTTEESTGIFTKEQEENTAKAKQEEEVVAGKEDEKTEEGDKPEADKPKDNEKVELKKEDLKLSEDSVIDDKKLDEILAYSKERGLSKEEAQKLLDMVDSPAREYAKKVQEDFEAKKATWREEIKSDKEIGGDNFGKSVELAKRVIERFADESFKEQLDETGLGDHPGLVRIFSRIGSKMGEDTLVRSTKEVSPSPKTFEDVFYGENKQ